MCVIAEPRWEWRCSNAAMKQSSRDRAQQQQRSKRKARKLSYTKQRRPEEEQNRCHSDAADDLGDIRSP
ncbi:unnamed protein product [Sphagnum troendelagicum]|uniref:Uncharacterized protein n=2 Tax=Sphagnum TaxID=13804 RepID=A0ABP0V2M0_9BRYO